MANGFSRKSDCEDEDVQTSEEPPARKRKRGSGRPHGRVTKKKKAEVNEAGNVVGFGPVSDLFESDVESVDDVIFHSADLSARAREKRRINQNNDEEYELVLKEEILVRWDEKCAELARVKRQNKKLRKMWLDSQRKRQALQSQLQWANDLLCQKSHVSDSDDD